MKTKILKSIFFAILLFLPTICMAQKSGTYKCVEITNWDEPCSVDDITYYIEFSDNGLTKWSLVNGEWKNPEWFEFERKHETGIVYTRKNYPVKNWNIYCVDHFEFSLDLKVLKRYYRCPDSPYQFDYVFKKIK